MVKSIRQIINLKHCILFYVVMEWLYYFGFISDERVLEKLMVCFIIILYLINFIFLKKWKDKGFMNNIVPFMFFIFLYIITSLINYKVGIILNLKTVIWLMLNLCVLTSISYFVDREIVNQIEKITLLFVTGLSAVALILWITDVGICFEDFHQTMFGALNGRVWLPNINAFSFCAIISVIWSFARITECCLNGQKKKYILYNIIFFVNYVYVYVSNVNTQKVNLLCLTILYLIVRIIKKKSKYKSVIILSITLCMLFLVNKIPKYLNNIIDEKYKLETVSMIVSSIGINNYIITDNWGTYLFDSDEGFVPKEENVGERKLTNNLSLSIRFNAWKAGLYILKDHLMMGIGANSGYLYSLEYPEHDFEWYTNPSEYTTHNSWLDVALNSGLIGFIVFLYGIINFTNNSIKKILISINSTNEVYDIKYMLVVMVAFFTGIMEPQYVYGCGIGVTIVWISLSFTKESSKYERKIKTI